jgi:hypothetical protein
MPRPASAPAASGPDRFLRQHGEIEAPAVNDKEFRTAWRRVSRIDQLFRDGAIGIGAWRRAVGFKFTYENAYRGTLRGHDWNAVYIDRHCHQRSGPEPTAGALDALGRLRVIRRSMGAGVFALLVGFVVDDRSWASLGKQRGICPKTAKCWTLEALRTLAAL